MTFTFKRSMDFGYNRLASTDDITDMVVPAGIAEGESLEWDETSGRYEAVSLARRTPLAGWPTFLYGNSYSILAASYFTAGRHYSQLLAESLGGGAVTSYGIGNKRILDVLSSLINEAPLTGLVTPPVAGSKWPGTTARNGLVLLESLVNDFGHYPAMNVTPAVPAALPSGNTLYKDSLAVQYRAALAIMSSESRVENTAFTAESGTWTNTGSSYASGGNISYTSTNGAYKEYSLTPPQSGPFAGKVFLHGYALDPAAGAMSQVTISVDGTVQTTRTPVGWEQYVGPGGANVNTACDVVAVTLPIDGAAHTVRVAQSGTGFAYVDFWSIPSANPNLIVIPGAEHALAFTGWTAAQKGAYHANEKALTPAIKAVAAEFPNVVWATSNLTPAGLWSGDLIHPNDLGMSQRAAAIEDALQTNQYALSRLRARSLALEPAGTYPIL